MSIKESEKLQYPEFQKHVNKEPLQCYYQKQTNDTYTSSGYSFYIKSPGEGMFLDPDVIIHYQLVVTEVGANTLANHFVTVAAAADTFANLYATNGSNLRIGFRGGNVLQKATQQMNVILNGHSITCEPWKFIEPLSRIYISDSQSKHEFSSSGGKFDNGNHSHRCINDIPMVGLSDAAINNQTLGINLFNGVHSREEVVATGGVRVLEAIQSAPLNPYFYNDGFNDRYMKFQDGIRRNQAPNAQVTVQYGANAATTTYTFDFYERLPIPPFKMFSNDEIHGIIPNIKDLTIRGQFATNLQDLVVRSSGALAAICTIGVPANGSNSAACELLLKWYTKPQGMSIPRSVTMPLRKINVWASNKTILALGAADNPGAIATISEYNISLDAIPDLLLIYLRFRVDSFTSLLPDAYFFEMLNLQINIEGASGKLNQIQTIDLYNKWKALLRHNDSNIPPFDEWRRNQCIAALQPDDYGVINGPGYYNPVTLGVSFNAQNWWNIPKMGLIPAENYAGTTAELVVVSIYDKWGLTILDSGSASSELTRIAPSMGPSSQSLGLSQLEPMGGGLRGIL